jgi:TolB-like protein
MSFKKTVFFVCMVLAASYIFAQTATLDEAISISSLEMGKRLNKGSKVAVLNFTSAWPRLSSYVIDEMDNAIVRENIITVIDRRELDLIRREQNFQMSGEVSDESAQSIGQLLGAETVMSGSFEVIGNTYRFRIRAIGVKTGSVQYSNSLNIKNDDVLSALMPPKYETITRDYNFVERLGIGLLNIPFGIGSLVYMKDGWLMYSYICFTASGALIGGVFLGDKVWTWSGEGALIGAAIPFGICAVAGFVQAFFFIHTEKKDRVRVSSFSPLNINLVADSSNNMGVQISYRLQLK